MKKVEAWKHRIHTTRQARACRRVADVNRLRKVQQQLSEQALAAARAAEAAEAALLRKRAIMQAVLNMDTPTVDGDTQGLPVVKQEDE